MKFYLQCIRYLYKSKLSETVKNTTGFFNRVEDKVRVQRVMQISSTEREVHGEHVPSYGDIYDYVQSR